jgi:hypothetical protein
MVRVEEKHYLSWTCFKCGLTCKKDIRNVDDMANISLTCWNCRHEVNNSLSEPEPANIHPFDTLKREAI